MKDTLTSVILSVKPNYAAAIMEGTKTVEFRKKVFKRPVDKVFVYSSSPQKKIIGYFTISDIIEDTAANLWRKFGEVGGIDKKDFFEYYKNSVTGYSIKIKDYEKFEYGLNPTDFFENFCAPQSYLYLDDKAANSLASNIMAM